VYLFNQNKKYTYKIGDQNTLAVNSHFMLFLTYKCNEGGIAFGALAVKYFVLKAPILIADKVRKRATHLWNCHIYYFILALYCGYGRLYTLSEQFFLYLP
jgi:hypothetical protein